MRADYYFNRELSWLEFNARVLEEAEDKSNPLLERMKFLAIVSSNFDEFFMVRVASLKAQVRAGDTVPDASGKSPAEQLAAIVRVADALDRGHDQRVRDAVFERREERFVIRATGVADLSLERLSLADKGDMFEDVFGLEPILS